jgi:DNA-binding response OmpR family regulator
MKRKIVLVEDDQDLTLIVSQILKNAGYEVIGLEGGIAIVNNQCSVPDLFIVDVNLSIIDGFALCKYLRLNNRTKAVPVVLMSASHEFRKRALEIGADYFIKKPIEIDELLQIIDKLTMRSDSLAENRLT